MRRIAARQLSSLVFASGLHDFFNSGTWQVIRNLALLFVVIFWAATAYWVYKDARRRIEDPWLVVMATLLGTVAPFVGPLIYMLFRPPEYLEDVRERELEIKAMEERLARRDLHCPVCRAEVDASFLVCPVCTTRRALRPAGVRRGGAQAGARDEGNGGAARAPPRPRPGAPPRSRRVLPRLPGLHDAPPAVVLELQGAAPGAVADRPGLLDRRR